jgi:uncharacterized protein YqcC (DUF446 family)
MCSLTDSQCEQWFNERKPKEKKPHRTQPTVVDGVSIPAVNQIVPSTTQLVRQDESSETTASIAQNFDDTLERNKDFYDRLLLELKA